jgi:hypothetical protein
VKGLDIFERINFFEFYEKNSSKDHFITSLFQVYNSWIAIRSKLIAISEPLFDMDFDKIYEQIKKEREDYKRDQARLKAQKDVKSISTKGKKFFNPKTRKYEDLPTGTFLATSTSLEKQEKPKKREKREDLYEKEEEVVNLVYRHERYETREGPEEEEVFESLNYAAIDYEEEHLNRAADTNFKTNERKVGTQGRGRAKTGKRG